MSANYLSIPFYSIALYFVLNLLSLYLNSLLDKNNGGEGFKIPKPYLIKSLSIAVFTTLIGYIVSLNKLSIEMVLFVTAIALVLTIANLLIKSFSLAETIQKDAAVINIENPYEDNYQFIKGLY